MGAMKWCVQFGAKCSVVLGRKRPHLSLRQNETWAPRLSSAYIILILKVCGAFFYSDQAAGGSKWQRAGGREKDRDAASSD